MDSLFLLVSSNPATLLAIPLVVIVIVVVVVLVSKKNRATDTPTESNPVTSASWKPAAPETIVEGVSKEVEDQSVVANSVPDASLSTQVIDPLPAKPEDVKPA
jgi:heme/copper-type cytochrome/quinol oxidase subunit 1